MPPAPLPANETDRLEALRSFDVLDTACEASFDNLTQLAAKLTDTPIALVSLVDRNRQWFKARHGLAQDETPRNFAFCAYALLNPGQPLLVNDATKDARFADNPLVTGPPHIRFYAGIPLVDPDGFALGTLCVLDYRPRELPQDMLDALATLAQAVTTTLHLRRAVRQVETFALTDALTGLPNRPAVLRALDQAIARQTRDGGPFSLLYLDLDGFKRVNETTGHSTGDRVLKTVASILRNSVRVQDTVGRLGGDEFAAVLVGGDGTEGALVSERVRASTELRMRECGWDLTVSIGAIIFNTPPADPIVALAEVGKLLYRAKADGRNRVASGSIPPGSGESELGHSAMMIAC